MSEQIEELPEGFRMTELGPLPEEWEVVRLGDVFKEVNKETRRIKILPDEKYKIVLTRLYAKGIQLKEIKIGKDISAEYMYQLRTGDFIFSKINLRKGAFDFVPNELNGAVVSTEHPILELNKSITNQNQQYIKFYMSQPSVWELFKKESKGFSGKERIKVREFFTIKIPLPPLSEQKKIAAVLSTVQEAKEKTEAVINAAKDLKRSMMKHLFTYGPVPPQEAENVPLKETEIGMVPEEWEVVRLGDVIEVHDKKRIPLSSEQRSTMKGFYPYCGANGIIDYINDYIFEGEYILLAEDGGFWDKFQNTAYLMNGKFWVNNHAHIIKAKERATNRFLLYWFNYEDIESYTSGTTRKKLNQGVMKRIHIPLPSLPEQKKIAAVLSAIDQKIEAEESVKKALEDLFKTLLHDLMTAKIRVNNLDLNLDLELNPNLNPSLDLNPDPNANSEVKQ
ncbi:MAG: type restriction enzyme subunit [Candidatus Methanomethylophilaceae archaeon]|nr:type restriction enzyme subunit [Candidatus Methanomethylophilaceae archaeon]